MPRRYRFRLETLLRVRKLQEDLKSQVLAEVRRDIRLTTRQREEIAALQRATFEAAGHAARHKFDASDVHRYYQYERHLARMADEKDAVIAQLRQREEHALDELSDAMKRKRTVERLKERSQGVHAALVNKEEQKATDETATNKAAVFRGSRHV